MSEVNKNRFITWYDTQSFSSQYPDFNTALTILTTFIDNLDSYGIVNCNANVIFITASMPGRNPTGNTGTDKLITAVEISAVSAKITAYNTAKAKTLLRVTAYSVGGCDINAKFLQELACASGGFY